MNDEFEQRLARYSLRSAPPEVTAELIAALRAQRAITLARLGTVACALERHHRAHGRYPESLLDLGPATLKSLPDDWMSGQPFNYRRIENARFELWSVGPDGKDDGGIYRTRNPKNNTVSEDRDWSWPSAAPNVEQMF